MLSSNPSSIAVEIRLPYLLFTGGETSDSNAKTAFGLRDWRPEACVGQWRLPGGTVDLGLPTLTPAQAQSLGVQSLLIGVAPVGGAIDPSWVKALIQALDAGLDIVSGMHTRLRSIPELVAAAQRSGRRMIDVRHASQTPPIGNGIKRSGKRLLTVGTDCALGKKYTALALTRAMQRAGIKATFRATGQTGIMISGAGIAVDAVVSDFVAGAAEALSPANTPDHWDVIEGQGSLFHPSYAGVSLGLLHGSQPDVIVLCHHPRRQAIDGHPAFAMPSLREAIDVHLLLGRRTNAAIRCVGIALNTKGYAAHEREALFARMQDELALPAFDPMESDLSPVLRRLTDTIG